MTNVMYQAYGNPRIYDQALFSILTLFGSLAGQRHDVRVVVSTDTPNVFEAYDITIEVLTEEIIRQWRGKYDFVHRLKIKAVEHCLGNYDGDVFYADTDTYFRTSPVELFRSLSRKTSIMFRREGIIGRDSHPSLHKFLRKNGPALGISDVSGIAMWNAGVIGIHGGNAALVQNVLALNDAMYDRVYRHTVEQFAFSYVLQKETGLIDAEASITHYYENRHLVEDVIVEFLRENRGANVQSCASAALSLDPVSRIHLTESGIGDKVADVFKRLKKSITKRAKRVSQKYGE